jgi:hypothetical protein
MSPRANVRSLDAVRQFRPAVVRFEDDVMAALTSLRTELNRTMQWLDHDCPAYWQHQIRNGFDTVAEARTQLSRKSMMTVAGHRSECIDEKKALARAKQQLEFAQEKLRVCRQWSLKAHRAADEYNSRIGRAEQTLTQGLPRLMAILERITLALESYTATEKPLRSEDRSTWVAPPAPGEEAAPAGEAAASNDAARVVKAGNETPADASKSAADEANVEGAEVPLANEAVEVPVEPARSRP